MGKSCFFVGHRDTPAEIIPRLLASVENAITQWGATEFVVGHYGAFDRMAASAVAAAKQKYPNIMLSLLIPYHPTERTVELPPGFDGTFYPPEMESVPKQFAISRANRYMINNADILIAYVWHPGSNARDMYEYACRRQKTGAIRVINLYP